MKFGNTKTVVGGLSFDSKKEAARWEALRLLELAGEVSELIPQFTFPLRVGGELICNYTCDFYYKRHGLVVIEDVKAVGKKAKGKRRFTTKTPAYQIKKKLLKALYGLTVKEV